MVMEGRDQQPVELNRDAHAMHSHGHHERLWDQSGQLDLFPDRWLRISYVQQNVLHIKARHWLKSPVREIRMRGSVGVLPPSLAFCNSKEER
jgi:hypothetical protein